MTIRGHEGACWGLLGFISRSYGAQAPLGRLSRSIGPLSCGLGFRIFKQVRVVAAKKPTMSPSLA